MSARFDRIFGCKTGFATLDRLLARLRANKSELLRVLERPEIPLNTNGSENDIRCQVTKRKISGGTRSDAGRDCRDAFLGLYKTCAKLGIAFWDYLGARLAVPGCQEIPALAEIVTARAPELACGHWLMIAAAGKQPALFRRNAGVMLGRPRLPPLPQQVEDLGRQHHVSVLAAFRLHDADDHLLTVDVARPQSRHLAGPQPAAGSYLEVVRPSAQRTVHFAHQRCGLLTAGSSAITRRVSSRR